MLGLARGNNPGWGGAIGNPNPSNSALDTPLGGDIVGGNFAISLALPAVAVVTDDIVIPALKQVKIDGPAARGGGEFASSDWGRLLYSA